MAEKQVRKALSLTTRVNGMSQEDAAHPARVHRADKEQPVKEDQTRILKIQETWKERLRQLILFWYIKTILN